MTRTSLTRWSSSCSLSPFSSASSPSSLSLVSASWLPLDYMAIFLKFNHSLQGHLSPLISKVRWRSKIIYMKFYRAVFFKNLIFMRTKMNIFWGGREIFILSRNKTLFQSENNGTLKFSRIFSPKQTLNLKKSSFNVVGYS